MIFASSEYIISSEQVTHTLFDSALIMYLLLWYSFKYINVFFIVTVLSEPTADMSAENSTRKSCVSKGAEADNYNLQMAKHDRKGIPDQTPHNLLSKYKPKFS